MSATMLPVDTKNDSYADWLAGVARRFALIPADTPLFQVAQFFDERGYGNLYNIYLGSFFTEDAQKHHTCWTCQAFFDRFGGLVTIDPATGAVTSAIWDPADAPPAFAKVAADLKAAVESSAVAGVFLSELKTLGTPRKGSPQKGTFSHFAVDNTARAFKSRTETAEQVMSERLERRRILGEALGKYRPELLAEAVQFLESIEVGRTEAVLGPMRWFKSLADRVKDVKHHETRSRLIWAALATVPPGFCRPANSMAGTVLDDLASGMPLAAAAKRFAEKTNPLIYQRPQAAPSDHQMHDAEKTFALLGLDRDCLRRRHATVAEVVSVCGESVVWTPRPERETEQPLRVFDHLRAAPENLTRELPPEVMTWARFEAEVLPKARQIELFAPAHAGYVAFTTAVVPGSGRILAWDTDDRNNPIGWYYIDKGLYVRQWGLIGERYHAVRAIVPRPCHWHGRSRPSVAQLRHFVIAAPQNYQGVVHGTLFKENFIEPLKKHGHVLEEHARRTPVESVPGLTDFAIGLDAGDGSKVRVRVDTGEPNRRVITIDRWM